MTQNSFCEHSSVNGRDQNTDQSNPNRKMVSEVNHILNITVIR